MNQKYIIILVVNFILLSDVYAKVTDDDYTNSKPISSYIIKSNKTQKIKNTKIKNTINTVKVDKPVFNIKEFRIKGNTLLDKILIERTVYSFLGKNKTFDDVDAAQELLEKTYKDAGYPVVNVLRPNQDFRDGIVTLQVVEGKISRLRITGSKYYSLKEIKNRVPSLSKGNVFFYPDVKKQLNTVNQISSDSTITPILKSGRYPGNVEVELKVKDTFPLHGEVEVNNRNTSSTTESRINVSLHYMNLFQKNHALGLEYQMSPEKTDEVKVATLDYIIPVGNEADALLIYGVNSNTNIATLGAVTVIGNGSIFGTRWLKNLQSGALYSNRLVVGFDYKNFNDTLNILGVEILFPISYWTATIDYSGSYKKDKDVFDYSAGFIFGIPLNSKLNQFSDKRLGSKPDFVKFKADASYKYSFENDMQIKSRVEAQIATSPLISNEQFSVGGVSTVRGYYEAQIVSDSGLIMSLELVSPKLLESNKDNSLRAHVFIDYGKTWRRTPLPGTEGTIDIYGAGLGFRFYGYDGFNIEADVANSLKSNGTINSNSTRWHLSFKYDF